MKPKYFSKIPVLFTVILFFTLIAAAGYEGESLVGLLGKSVESQEVKDLESGYKCDMLNNNHYASSTDGVELKMKNGVLNQIYLYNKSNVYGTYKGKLPNKLSFGMGTAQVKATVGKTTTSYNTGYCEFDMSDYILSCWFEGGALNQVIISTKDIN